MENANDLQELVTWIQREVNDYWQAQTRPYRIGWISAKVGSKKRHLVYPAVQYIEEHNLLRLIILPFKATRVLIPMDVEQEIVIDLMDGKLKL